jgi:hypothetical protein
MPRRPRWLIGPSLCFFVALGMSPAVASQCFSGDHFRGGLWRQWIVHLVPGPMARQQVAAIVEEVNRVRAEHAITLLVTSPRDLLAVGITDESNVRGPGGFAHSIRNQEIFVGTLISDAGGRRGFLFLDKALMSTSELIAAGVPGRIARFRVKMEFNREDRNEQVDTTWIANSDEGDNVRFRTRYASAAVATRLTVPDMADYLSCQLAPSLFLVFRSRPAETFLLSDQSRFSLIRELDDAVTIELQIRLADQAVNRVFNDPENKPLRLIEGERAVRIHKEPK